jgi:hypothetical protein
MRKTQYLLVLMHLQTALLLGTADLPTNARLNSAKSRRPLALAFVQKTTSRKEYDMAKDMLSESRDYKVNNRLMSANQVNELLSSSGCDLLCPSQAYPDIFRRWYWRNSYQGCVFKASALQNGINYVPIRSERFEKELLRKKKKSTSTADLNSAVDNISKGTSYLGLSCAVASGTYVLSTVLSGIAAGIAAGNLGRK